MTSNGGIALAKALEHGATRSETISYLDGAPLGSNSWNVSWSKSGQRFAAEKSAPRALVTWY